MKAGKSLSLTLSVLHDSYFMGQLQERWEGDQAEPLIQGVLNKDDKTEKENFEFSGESPQKIYLENLMQKKALAGRIVNTQIKLLLSNLVSIFPFK